ncbi:hypothetical protein MP638_003197 [Amoeboaphelidium occidentale]|nr:hypothetical protein MP638_003197 [Amoeboaphelidium occidentale]
MSKKDIKIDIPQKSSQAAQQQPHDIKVISLVIAFYWVVSFSVVFLNKHIMSSSENKFPYPLMVTYYQFVVALLLLVSLGQLGKSIPMFSIVPPFEFNKRIAGEVLPLTIVYVLMLALNNLCLQYVEVTFYQVARSLTILFNIIFTYTYLGQSTSKGALISCAVVFFGFVFGSYGELNFSWRGVIFGVGSSFFVALYGIYVKKTLIVVDNNQWRLLHYNTALSLLVMLPFIWFSGEVEHALENVTFWHDSSFWTIMTVTGITGFLINIAVFLQIKFTTPLTNTISGTAKASVQTILAWFIWQNIITATNAFGIFLSLLGSSLYSYVRYKEMKK